MDNNQCSISNNPNAYSGDTSNVRNQSILGVGKQQQRLYPKHYNEHNILNRRAYAYCDSSCNRDGYSSLFKYLSGVWIK